MRTISVTIATYKRHEFLKRIINSLANQSLDKSRYEVLICDSNSGRETDEVVRAVCLEHPTLNIRHLQTSNILAAKRNIGIQGARNEIVIFLDDDCLMESDYLERYIKYFDKENKKFDGKKIVCGEVRFPNEWISQSNYYRFRDEEGFYFDKTPDIKLNFRTIVVMNMAFLKEEFLKDIKKVNENFIGYGMEDQELGWRLEKAGYEIIGANARVYHHEMSNNIRGYGKKIFHTARDGAATLLSECPEAFRNIRVLKLIDPDYPHESSTSSYLFKFMRLILFNNLLMRILIKWVTITDGVKIFYSKTIFRYILANYYIAGARQRTARKATQDDWYV